MEDRLQAGVEVGHGFEALLAAQVRVDRVPLDGARADDRHLHDQVVQVRRPRLGQRLHLRPALDLEHAHGVRGLEHREHLGDLLRDPVEVEADGAVVLDKPDGLVDGGEHAEAEQVELDQLHRLDVALVVLDDDPVLHRRPLDGGDVDEGGGGDRACRRCGWTGGGGSRRCGRTAPASAPSPRGPRRSRVAAVGGRHRRGAVPGSKRRDSGSSTPLSACRRRATSSSRPSRARSIARLGGPSRIQRSLTGESPGPPSSSPGRQSRSVRSVRSCRLPASLVLARSCHPPGRGSRPNAIPVTLDPGISHAGQRVRRSRSGAYHQRGWCLAGLRAGGADAPA